MTAVPTLSAPPGARPLRLARTHADGRPGETLAARIVRMAEAGGMTPSRLVADIAGLALSAGRIGFADYERLRLYDPAFWDGADRREVAGARQGRRLARLANFRRDCLALANDRIASGAYLAAHGLPTVPTLAVFHAGLAAPGGNLLRTRDELRHFLAAHVHQPLIVRPAEGDGVRSLFADRGLDPHAEIDRLVEATGDAPGVSWMIQPRIAPPSGDRLTPVRLLTLAGERGAKLFRAAWRLGGRDDLVAGLDLRTGQALTLAPAHAPHRARPAPSDLAVPGWAALKATAVEGARLLGQFGLLGWDVAAGADGPVILGLDPAPDLDLHQLADRRGVLDLEFRSFLAERRRAGQEWRKTAGPRG